MQCYPLASLLRAYHPRGPVDLLVLTPGGGEMTMLQTLGKRRPRVSIAHAATQSEEKFLHAMVKRHHLFEAFM